MPTYFSKQIIDDVNKLLDIPPEEQAVLTTWKQILAYLRQHCGIKKDEVKLHPKFPFVHLKNRGGYMLNGFEAHRVGASVQKVGANTDELHGAAAMEISPNPAERKEQMEKNAQLAKSSNGLLASPSGEETHMTIGRGHMAAFCRAANAGCRTVFKNIQSRDGNISLEILKKTHS